ncbi:MAG: hypothetical protein KAR19_08710 [Bacteroidales bacterium]|nr:hypothetical protein [Bacteroidales bacterium]
MITRKTLVTIIVLLAGFTTGYFVSQGVNNFLDIIYQENDLSELNSSGCWTITGNSTL